MISALTYVEDTRYLWAGGFSRYSCEECGIMPAREHIDGWMPDWPRCPVCGENLTIEAVR